jgi:hypothetical protein
MNLMSLLSPSQVKWWQGCGSPGLQESLTWPRPALDSSEAGPEPRVHCGKTPPPPQGGPGPGRSPSSQSVIKGQNPEEESFSSSADRTAPPQMSPDLHSPGWGVWSDPTSQKSWLRSRCCPEERESWREEHRKLSFLPPTQVLPQACSTQSGAEGGSGHVYFWNSKPASCLIPVPMAPQCGDDDWCRFRKVGVLMPGTPCDENATLQQTASMSPLLSLHSAWCFWMFGHEVLHYGRTLSCRVYHRKPQNPNVSPWSPIISHNQTFQSTSWLSL